MNTTNIISLKNSEGTSILYNVGLDANNIDYKDNKTVKEVIDDIENGEGNYRTVISVNEKTGSSITIEKNDIELGNVENVKSVAIDMQSMSSPFNEEEKENIRNKLKILELGTNQDQAFRGDKGGVAYTHAQNKGDMVSNGIYKFGVNSYGHVSDPAPVTK